MSSPTREKKVPDPFSLSASDKKVLVTPSRTGILETGDGCSVAAIAAVAPATLRFASATAAETSPMATVPPYSNPESVQRMGTSSAVTLRHELNHDSERNKLKNKLKTLEEKYRREGDTAKRRQLVAEARRLVREKRDNYFKEEVDSRIIGQKFRDKMLGIKRDKGYYDKLRKQKTEKVNASTHYNPKKRERIGRGYTGEKTVWDWSKELPPEPKPKPKPKP